MGLLLIVISVLVWTQRSSRPFLIFGWCWFLGTLVPVLGIVQVGVQAMADRYAYVPLIGVFVTVVWVAWGAVGKVARVVSIAVVLLSLSLLTIRQLGYWKSNYDLWSHTLAVTQNNLVAEDKLGSALQALGRQDEAMIHFANAVRLDSLDPFGNFSLGADLQWHGHLREAIPHYEITIRQTNDARLRADAYQNLGTDYLQLGDEKLARENFLLALRTNPGLITVFAGLGELAGEPARGLSQAVVQTPTAEGFQQLAAAFRESGRVEEAGLADVVARNVRYADDSKGAIGYSK
jgi:tetratricopeptide (TPR) repeat protein